MRWLNFALLLFISIFCSCMSHHICSDEFPEIASDDDMRCIQRDTEQVENNEGNFTCELDSNVTLTVVDSQAGILSVEFKLAPSSCRFVKYHLELYIEESFKDEESCKRLLFIEDIHSERVLMALRKSNKGIKDDKHSERVLMALRKPDEKKLSYCKERENVVFHNVYTGCYVLRISTENEDTFIKPAFIETKYVKTSLIDKVPRISSQYLPIEGELEFVFANMSALNITRMDLHTRMCLSYPCTCQNGSKQHWWEVTFSMAGNFMCKAKNERTIYSSTQCHFDKSGDRMICSIKNVTSGMYCVLMQIYDDRCVQDTVWNKGEGWKCLFNTEPINVTAAYALRTTTIKQPPSAPVFDIAISIVAVLCMISLGVLLYLWLRGKPKPDLVSEPKKQALSQQKTSIILLYALDCKPFMTLMSMFRDILKEITKCEIYDCFDPERAEEIALNKTDWLRKHMAFSKVVLVENKCAVLHQKALLKQKKLTYRDSVTVFMDDLFMYGLKILTDDCFGKSMYERVFVVRIEGFTETKDVLSYVAPLTRYSIPQHMEQLLSSLYQSQSEYAMDSGMRKLIECLKNLENYKTEKPEYLSNMFIKESQPTVKIV